jgi:N-acetylglucosaminyl-diphospho-decaprenol L-rhamnosyltransferase
MNRSNTFQPKIEPVLSIVIVNWNTRDSLAQCLESVVATPHLQIPDPLNQSGIVHLPPFTLEVWVVDNCSTDGSAQMVQARFPWVRLVENLENIGFARANNQVIRESKGRYVLLLNPDTEVKSGALQALVCFMDAHPQAGAVGPQLLNLDNTLQPSCHPAPTLPRELWRLFHLDALWPYALYPMAKWDLDTPRRVDVVQGACLLLRRATLDQVGLFDEDYFIYSEEMDLCYRLEQAGWRIYWVPEAEVIHYGGHSTQQVAMDMFLRLYQSKLLYFRKRHGWLAARGYKLILVAATLARLSVSPLAWLERSPQRQRHLTLASYYLRLLKAVPEL